MSRGNHWRDTVWRVAWNIRGRPGGKYSDYPSRMGQETNTECSDDKLKGSIVLSHHKKGVRIFINNDRSLIRISQTVQKLYTEMYQVLNHMEAAIS